MQRSKTQINVLKANHGDCLLIETHDLEGNGYNILIDGGTYKTYHYFLREKIENLKVIHLLVLTHIDDDHIAGLIQFFKSELFKQTRVDRFWINGANLLKIDSGSSKISYAQGTELERLLTEKGVDSANIDKSVSEGTELIMGSGLSIEVLSPSLSILQRLYKDWPEAGLSMEPDHNLKVSVRIPDQIAKGSLHELSERPFRPQKPVEADIFNSSSIAFVLITPSCRLLLLGDSRAEVIESALRKKGYSETHKIDIDLVKISHHGSLNNTSCELLGLVRCKKYLITTDGGKSRSRHPDRETIARILCHKERDFRESVELHFNYPLAEIEEKAGVFVTLPEMAEENFLVWDDVKVIIF